jgi:hypothetical protein
MITRVGFDSILKWMLLSGWFLLFLGGIVRYPGSYLTYMMFSVVFLAMLISGFYRQVSYGYLFLVVMLWLGFWLKLTVHLLADYPFGEPIGFFGGTPAAWDAVLPVATIGSLAVMTARLIYSWAGAPSVMLTQNIKFKAPVWYVGVRKRMWAGMALACIGLAIINASLGIMQSGLVPSTILLWPFNAVIGWLIAYGLAFGIATLLWWDIALGRNVSLVVYFVLLEAFVSTISLLSRGAYIFHIVPQFLGLYKNRKQVIGWSRRNIIAVSITFVVLFGLSNPLVNILRNFYYSGVPLSFVNKSSELTGNLGKLAKFSVDRWIGVEGVMAASAYPKQGGDLFVRALMERAEIGKCTIYQEVCQSNYRYADMQKFQFASLPGAVGFLYFTGYLWAVALGLLVLVLAMLSSEGLVFRITSNPLLSALWGGAAANAVAQMGVGTRGLLIYFFEMSCGIAVIWFIQSEWASMGLRKFSALNSAKSGA